MVKVGVKKVVAPDGKKVKLKPFEDNFHLETFLQYFDGGQDIGATFLKKNKKENYRLVFGFHCLGISPILSEDELFNILGGFKAFNDLPLGETLTFHFGSFIDDRERQAYFKQQMEEVDSDELRLLLGGTAKRIHELTKAGVRKNNFLNLYVTYTVSEGVEAGKGDWADRCLAVLEKGWYQATGAYEEVKSRAIEQIILEGYLRGFNRWRRLLSNQIGVQIEPMTTDEMIEADWRRFNRLPRQKAMPRIVCDVKSQHFTEQCTTIHPKSLLLEQESPTAYRHLVKVKGEYTGVLLLADKPEIPDDDPAAQLFYLLNILSKESVYNFEFFTQVRRGNNNLLKDKMNSITKQAQNASNLAASKGDIDVGASIAVEKAVEAQASLYLDAEPFHTGTVVLVHRPTQRGLDRACADFMSYFRREGWIVREEEYAHRIWLETFPTLMWESLLGKPFNRHRTYVTEELPRITPLVFNRSRAKEGFEFIATEGGTPIFLPLYQQPCHVGVFATKGSGKSMLMTDLLLHSLPHNMVSTVLEVPRSDGLGSFDALCDYLPDYCSYVDTGDLEKGSNIVEPPDLRGFTAKDQGERFAQFKEDLLDLVVNMVMGFKPSASVSVNPDTVRSILLLAIEAFYEDIEIRQRFAMAFQRGFGSSEWQQMPVFPDFIPFCSLERLRLPNATTEVLRVLDYIKLRLNYWRESRLGQFLSKVSSFRADSKILILSLRGLNNETDAALLGSIAYNSSVRRSLSFKDSIFLADEANILFHFDPLALQVGRLFSNGRKSGIRVVTAGQGLGSLVRCVASDQIFDNMDIKLTGKILPQSTDIYVDLLKYPYDLIAENGSERYGINKFERYSQWLFDDGRLIPVRHYPGDSLFSLVANNPSELEKRHQFWQQYRGDKVRGLFELTQQFSQAS
ncbi:MAG: ATP-binding protein [Cyanobacteria bacterium P01_G01_bin.49]